MVQGKAPAAGNLSLISEIEGSLFPVSPVGSVFVLSALPSQRERMRGQLQDFLIKGAGSLVQSCTAATQEGSKSLSLCCRSSSCSPFRPAPEQPLCTARSKMRHKRILSCCKCASPYGFVKTMLRVPKPTIRCPDPGNCNMERQYPLRIKKSTKYFIYVILLRIGRDVANFDHCIFILILKCPDDSGQSFVIS